MNELAAYLVEKGVPPFATLGTGLSTFLLVFGVAFFLLMGFFMPLGGLMTYVERKIAAFTQSRIGPNRVGPIGLLQFLADGVKLILKEDILSKDVDTILFKAAPYAVVGGAFLVMIVLPLGPNLVPVDMDLGILVYLAASSFVTMGIVMSGWASNNKWSTMGAARSVAQIVSYEIPVGLSLLPVVLLTGSLSFQTMTTIQGWAPWQWNMFHNPGLFLCAFCYFIAALAEINRTPFDIPEAESELVSGYNTEYSGMRFGMFFMAEFANVVVISIITVIAFAGGWHFPGETAFLATYFDGAHPTFVQAIDAGKVVPFVAFQAIGHATLMAKASVLVVLVVLLRWTLPRVRVDQLMNLCWKYLVPTTIAATVLTGAWMIPGWTEGLSWSPTGGGWPERGPAWLQGHRSFVPLAALMLVFAARAWRDSREPWAPARRRAGRPANLEAAHGR